MKKIIGASFIFILLIMFLSGCSSTNKVFSNNTDIAISTSTTVTATEETSKINRETEKTADTESADQSSTAESISQTQKQTTVKSTTKQAAMQTTTKRVTTTKATTNRQTTTTTTSAPYWCTEGGSNHVVNVGAIGWYSSYSKAENAAKAYINSHDNVRGYAIDECDCGLFTAQFTFF